MCVGMLWDGPTPHFAVIIAYGSEQTQDEVRSNQKIYTRKSSIWVRAKCIHMNECKWRKPPTIYKHTNTHSQCVYAFIYKIYSKQCKQSYKRRMDKVFSLLYSFTFANCSNWVLILATMCTKEFSMVKDMFQNNAKNTLENGCKIIPINKFIWLKFSAVGYNIRFQLKIDTFSTWTLDA